MTEAWSSCSRSCDEGVKTRKVQCVREVALGTEVVVSDSECKEAQPPTHKPCNLMPCRVSRGPNPLIMAEDTLYVQKEPLKRLSLKIGGKAVVFEGTTLKIRCPHRRLHEGPVIEWMKDDQKIVQTTRLHFTGKNGLRIKQVTFSDAGIYSCSINSTRANLILSIKPDDNRRRGFVSHSLRKPKKGKKTSKKEGMDNTTLNALNPFGSDWEGSSKFVSDEHKSGGGEWKKEKMMERLETSSDSPAASFGVARSSASRSSREPMSQLRQLLSDLSYSLSATYATSEPVLASTVSSLTQSSVQELTNANNIPLVSGTASHSGLEEDEVLDWLISDWSRCSQKCGATGVQVRDFENYDYESSENSQEKDFSLDSHLQGSGLHPDAC